MEAERGPRVSWKSVESFENDFVAFVMMRRAGPDGFVEAVWDPAGSLVLGSGSVDSGRTVGVSVALGSDSVCLEKAVDDWVYAVGLDLCLLGSEGVFDGSHGSVYLSC